MTRGTVYVFARAPALGAVKRRLAADIGAVAAWRFQRDTTRAVVRRLAREPRWRTVLAATPDRRAGSAWRGLPSVACVPQGRGDLGQRMARVLARARPAVVVGADVPDIEAAHVARAFRALARHDAVFGPAPDGGYWLVGVRDMRALPRLFEGVRWSSAHALADTLANVPSHRSFALVDTLADIDDGRAWQRWRGHFSTETHGASSTA